MLSIGRLPRYMCTETVDRSTFRAEKAPPRRSCDGIASRTKALDWKVRKESVDRLRLDVAVSGDNEMYSWAGENHFQDRSLADLVQSGATSTGAFASFLISIFGSNAATFSYNGDVDSDGRALVEFGFHIPLEKSGYVIGDKVHHAIVPYSGTFLVDPRTDGLVRMAIHTDEIPPDIDACEDRTTLNYSVVRLNNSEFLLPSDVRLQIVRADGTTLENHTVFSGCHEFLGESSLRFNATADATQSTGPNARLAAVLPPPGLSFTVALTEPIDTTSAAAGDAVKARLTASIRGNHKNLFVPKGALVSGRIIKIQRTYGLRSESLRLGIRLETVEVNGIPQAFYARLQPVSSTRQPPLNSVSQRQDLGSFDEIEEPDAGFLQFDNIPDDFVVKRGMRIDGTTVAQH